MEKVWIDYADDYICLVTGFKLCYEIILVRDSDDNTHKEWFHGVLYLDEYTEEELKKRWRHVDLQRKMWMQMHISPPLLSVLRRLRLVGWYPQIGLTLVFKH